jgi:hypothetical protein
MHLILSARGCNECRGSRWSNPGWKGESAIASPATNCNGTTPAHIAM